MLQEPTKTQLVKHHARLVHKDTFVMTLHLKHNKTAQISEHARQAQLEEEDVIQENILIQAHIHVLHVLLENIAGLLQKPLQIMVYKETAQLDMFAKVDLHTKCQQSHLQLLLQEAQNSVHTMVQLTQDMLHQMELHKQHVL